MAVSVPGTQPTKHLSTPDEEEGSDDDGDDTSPISGNGETFIMYIPSPSVPPSSPTWLRCVLPFAFGVFRGRRGNEAFSPHPFLIASSNRESNLHTEEKEQMKWEGPSHSYEGGKEGMILIWEISQRTHIYPPTPIIIIILFFLCVLAWLECDPRPSSTEPCPSLPLSSLWPSARADLIGSRAKRPVTARGKRLFIEACIQRRIAAGRWGSSSCDPYQ